MSWVEALVFISKREFFLLKLLFFSAVLCVLSYKVAIAKSELMFNLFSFYFCNTFSNPNFLILQIFIIIYDSLLFIIYLWLNFFMLILQTRGSWYPSRIGVFVLSFFCFKKILRQNTNVLREMNQLCTSHHWAIPEKKHNRRVGVGGS